VTIQILGKSFKLGTIAMLPNFVLKIQYDGGVQ
jgi:hypothetical protein